ncbi:hypothetical protein L9F63_012183, partial [Diploptera punctata]
MIGFAGFENNVPNSNMLDLDSTYECQRRIYVCVRCGKMYSHERSLKTHIRLECGKEPHIFIFVGSFFMNYRHMGLGNYELEDYSTEQTGMARALKKRRYSDIGEFECPKCLKKYGYFRTLRRHLRLECGKEPQLKCPYCPKLMIHKANLKQHIFQDTSFATRPRCLQEACVILLPQEEEYEICHNSQHLNKSSKKGQHNNKNQVNCPLCGKLYRWRSNMLRHRRQECGKEPQYQCPYCLKKTKQKGNLMMHIKGHMFLSILVSKDFSLYTSLNLIGKNIPQQIFQSKQKIEEPGAYICSGCGKLYKWRTSMLKHKRQECGKEPQFQCPYCPKKTKQKGNLMQHIKSIHATFEGFMVYDVYSITSIFSQITTDREDMQLLFPPTQQQSAGDHVCTKCGRRYRQYSSLWRHYTYECGKDPQFQCPFCPHRATQKVSLKKHICCRHPESKLTELEIREKIWIQISKTKSSVLCCRYSRNVEIKVNWFLSTWCSTENLEVLLPSGRTVSRRSLLSYSNKPELFPCTTCGKVYQWKKTLLRHVRHECGKGPQFQCPYCPQRTTQKNSLKNHILHRRRDSSTLSF